jgi:RNA polymerase sigma-70 factor (ECF subfamily)
MTAFAARLALMTEQPLLAHAVELPCERRDDAGASLLRRAIDQRDEAAWSILVSQHYPPVLRQAMRACGDHSVAEDIAQEVFLKIFRSGPSFRGDRPLAHWIARITSRTAIDVIRCRPNQTSELRETHAASRDDPANDAVRSDSQRRVREAIQRLPGHLREIVSLTTFAGLSYDDAARELGIPLRTAMSRSMAARAQLRRTLKSLGNFE